MPRLISVMSCILYNLWFEDIKYLSVLRTAPSTKLTQLMNLISAHFSP